MVAEHAVHEEPTEDLTARERITRAAMTEFGTRGLRGATMRGIAASAGVSLGLVQHHFGTKDGLREACDQFVLDMLRYKTAALEEDRLGDPQVLATLMAMGPLVQRYVARALVDGSPRVEAMVHEVMTRSEEFLSSWWPDTFEPTSQRTRDAGAVMTAVNTSIMVLQPQLARRMQVEPWTEEAVQRTGMAMFDVFEAIARLVDSDMWQQMRAGIDAYTKSSEE